MCGLYGAIGPAIDPKVIRLLAILNEARGRDAIGFFNSRGAWCKNAERATVELRNAFTTKWLEDSARKTWAVCGHTRAGTRGGAVTKNAHPFVYGKVIGSHNGTIPDAPNKYSVDTEWAIDLLSKSKPGDYQSALGDVMGWYVLTWLDRRDNAIYLLNWEGTLHLTCVNDVWYYSSEGDHLRTALGVESKICSVAQGQVVRFWMDKKKGLQVEDMPDFTGKKRTYPSTDFGHQRATSWRSSHNDVQHIGSGIPAQAQQHITQRPNKRTFDPMLPTGHVVRFPTGMWYAHLGNNKFRMIAAQSQVNNLYPDVKPGVYKWMRPGEVRSVLTAVTMHTPITDMPPGYKLPLDLMEDIKVMGPDDKKKEEPPAAKPAFLTEEEQERADLEAVKAATMDREGSDAEQITQMRQQRFRNLTEKLNLTKEEATRVMVGEGYYNLAGN